MKYLLSVFIVVCLLAGCYSSKNYNRPKTESFLSEMEYGEVRLYVEGEREYSELSEPVQLYIIENKRYIETLTTITPLLKKGKLTSTDYVDLVKFTYPSQIIEAIKKNENITEDTKTNYIKKIEEADNSIKHRKASDYSFNDWTDVPNSRKYYYDFEGKKNGFDYKAIRSKVNNTVFWHVQLRCDNVLKMSNSRYSFTFDAYTNNEFQLDTAIQSLNDYTDNAFIDKKFSLIADGDWNTYQYMFQGVSGVRDLMLVFKVGLAPKNTILQVRDISIKEIVE
jgi:hypothetical protein